jgi:tRNA(fMet)-specific endonuclease VapC
MAGLMQTVLVDTDVFSFIFKGDSRGALYLPHLDGPRSAIALMTVAEARRWQHLRNWGPARTQTLHEAIRRYVILYPDDETAELWAQVASLPGHPAGASDAWIAATALRHRIPLVTHNRRHFEHIPNLQIISEA